MKKPVVLLGLVFVLLLGMLAGCSDSSTPAAAEAVKGSVQTWGNISIFVPEGMTLSGGSLIDPEDPDSLWIQLDENQMHYFLVNIVDEETAVSSVDATKEMNDGAADVSVTIGSITWKGAAYKYAGMTDCFQMWASVNGKIALVQAAWYAYDGAEAKAVLESIKLS